MPNVTVKMLAQTAALLGSGVVRLSEGQVVQVPEAQAQAWADSGIAQVVEGEEAKDAPHATGKAAAAEARRLADQSPHARAQQRYNAMIAARAPQPPPPEEESVETTTEGAPPPEEPPPDQSDEVKPEETTEGPTAEAARQARTSTAARRTT